MRPPRRAQQLTRVQGKKTLRNSEFVFLHISKTGGSTVNTLAAKLRRNSVITGRLLRAQHTYTIARIRDELPDAKIGFVIRDPLSRFVSGFNSRLRSGRPAHENFWNAEEAAAYSFFPTANDLAEALLSEDERMKSASQFAMTAINHLRRGYEYHLGSPEEIEEAADSIYHVCDITQLDDQIIKFFEPLGATQADIDRFYSRKHEAGVKPLPLSEKAEANIRTVWQREFQLYEYCRAHICKA